MSYTLISIVEMFGVVNLREIKLYKLKCQRIVNYSENTK